MKTEQVREHFRAQVSNYPELMRRLIPFYDDQRDLMLALMQHDRVAPLRVLDIGCGPGLMAVRMLAEFPQRFYDGARRRRGRLVPEAPREGPSR